MKVDTPPSCADIFLAMEDRITPALAARLQATFLFQVDGPDGGLWRVDLTRQVGPFVTPATDPSPADCRIHVSTAEEWVRVATGQRSATVAFLRGSLRVQGPLRLALALTDLLGESRAR